MSEIRKTASIRALNELKSIIELQKDNARDFKPYNELQEAKNEVLKTIAKQIEEEAIKKYAKYGLIASPVCHRRSTSADHLDIDLKIKDWPGLEKQVKAAAEADKKSADMKRQIDEWYFKALQSVAKKEELPEIPQFKPVERPKKDDEEED